eukprot:CAMPEP_0206051270 /NCGR_PEP_ID=MMETSP1466-20131121/31088_1 /ASSEMBLY_ACC=CAM_ASM_001126 /TAXON_ID=44452 /ORGANISM="Pavlova gyrans, Strain CCMP608" /LENGTH=45 /DNA_ID= /DNA_START= /DNA_END= /DNA_ORIENTATION=
MSFQQRLAPKGRGRDDDVEFGPAAVAGVLNLEVDGIQIALREQLA